MRNLLPDVPSPNNVASVDAESKPVLLTVMLPEPLEIDMPVPAVRVFNEYPDPFPMGSCPLVGVDVSPVPPFATPTADQLNAPLPLFVKTCPDTDACAEGSV